MYSQEKSTSHSNLPELTEIVTITHLGDLFSILQFVRVEDLPSSNWDYGSSTVKYVS